MSGGGTASCAGCRELVLLTDDHARLAELRHGRLSSDAAALGGGLSGTRGDGLPEMERGLVPSPWTTVHAPPAYLDRGGWPLQLAVLSPDGSHLALSGYRGVAVVQLSTQRWRFLSGGTARSGGATAAATQQPPFYVSALVWLSSDAILAATHTIVLPVHAPSTARDNSRGGSNAVGTPSLPSSRPSLAPGPPTLQVDWIL